MHTVSVWFCVLRLVNHNFRPVATVWGNANPLNAATDAMDFLALLYAALAKLKTVTSQTTLKRSILTRRMTLKTERSETYSMDQGFVH